jgi:hypothetical protein
MFDFNKVKLISHSSFIQNDYSILEQVAYIARVSNPANQQNTLHRPERKMRQNYLKNKNYQSFLLCYLINQIGGVKAPFFIGIRLHLTTSSLL